MSDKELEALAQELYKVYWSQRAEYIAASHDWTTAPDNQKQAWLKVAAFVAQRQTGAVYGVDYDYR